MQVQKIILLSEITDRWGKRGKKRGVLVVIIATHEHFPETTQTHNHTDAQPLRRTTTQTHNHTAKGVAAPPNEFMHDWASHGLQYAGIDPQPWHRKVSHYKMLKRGTGSALVHHD